MNKIVGSFLLSMYWTALLPVVQAAEKVSTEILDELRDNSESARIFGMCGSVRFVLYNEGKPVFTADADDEGTIFEGLLSPKHEVVFLVHGFHNGCDKEFIKSTKEAYFESRPDVQVVTVCYDIAEVSNLLFPWTRFCFHSVAGKIKTVMSRVHDEAKVNWKHMTLIGHSFGGQVVGEVGNLLNGKIVWLIALDAVAISFEFRKKLKPQSAQNVIVVHTGGYPLGLTKPAGTADFYVNGGKSQPGCNFIKETTDMCSHRRSYRVFKHAILNNKTYKAQQCDSYDSYITGQCERNPTTFLTTRVTKRGKFYFNTEATPPYKQIKPAVQD